jgi:hypothetical protein
MRNLNFEQLNKELIKREIVFEPGPTDMYETCCELEAIYEWGFTTVTYTSVLDPVVTFYDWECQSILSLDRDEYTTYKVSGGILFATERFAFSDDKKSFVVDLRKGAPVHVRDIKSIGYVANELYADYRYYELHDGRIFYKEDGKDIRLVDSDVTVDTFKAMGYTVIDPEHYDTNVNVLNEMLSKAMI